MDFLKVKLWGEEIGRLAWNPSTRQTLFFFNPQLKDAIPDISPLQAPGSRRDLLMPVYGDDRKKYQGLPPFISDSLPESWGNILIDKWIKENKLPPNKVTPLYKLMFIGKRGMGALEYEPYAIDMMHDQDVDLKALYQMSLKVLNDNDHAVITPKERLTLQTLLSVGTSAGGRQMKAIIAIDKETGDIRSGWSDNLEGLDYYILKFGNSDWPVAEVEHAFYLMAKGAGIPIEESRLLQIENIPHFLTRRFDRKDGKKVHVQTLAAINPDAESYEDLIATCRELGLGESEIEQVYRQLVFNVLSNNTDDHNKNFSFLLEKGGKWHMAPAYDVTYTFNANGTGPNKIRMMSLRAKTTDITKEDLLEFAKENGIRNAKAVIKEVASSLMRFDQFAESSGLQQPWRGIIQKTISENLASFGYGPDRQENESLTTFTDTFGRAIEGATLSINSKGHFELSAIIDGNKRRRFIKPNMIEYHFLRQLDIYNVPSETMNGLIESLLPPEINNSNESKR